MMRIERGKLLIQISVLSQESLLVFAPKMTLNAYGSLIMGHVL